MAKGKNTAGAAARRVPVTLRALLQRINRKLAKDGEQLRKSRGARDFYNLGDYYVIDLQRNFVTAHHIDPEAMAREIGVLEAWESVEAEG